MGDKLVLPQTFLEQATDLADLADKSQQNFREIKKRYDEDVSRALRANYAFFAYRNTTVSYTTGQTVIFDAEQYDPDGIYSTVNGRFTPGVPGRSAMSSNIELSGALTADQWFALQVFRNGAQVDQGAIVFQRGTKIPTASVYTEFDHDADDWFDIRIVHNKGSSHGINFGVSYAANFKGHLIGII